MGKVGNAIAGVATSGALLVGAYAAGSYETGQEREAIAQCVELFSEGQARTDCIQEAKGNDDGITIPDILALTGAIGIVGCGYLGYKTVKEEANTTGIMDDLF